MLKTSVGEWLKGTGPESDIVMSSRVRLARNLAHYPFVGRASETERSEIEGFLRSHLKKTSVGSRLEYTNLGGLEDLDRQFLVERQLISREHADATGARGVAIDPTEQISLMINEEDHLRIQVLQPGLEFKKVWKRADELDSGIESHIDYAYDSELGFLTACPTNLGTGLRASAMMHLPGLVMSKNMDKVINAVNQLGIAVRGLFGEGSDASGSIFQISNQQTLGESEDAIIDRLNETLKNIVKQENFAREKLMQDDGLRLVDKISRAVGILKSCHLIQSSESMDLLSLVRLATDFNMLPDRFRALADRMFIEIQPGHVQFSAGKPVEPADRDNLRAELLRKEFSRTPQLNLEGAS